MKRRSIAIAVGIGAVLIVGAVGAFASKAPTKVKTIKVVQTPAKVVLALTGKLEPIDEAIISSSLSPTRISKVNVDLGAAVTAGQPLVVLDTSQLASQRSQALANLASAQSSLARANAAAIGAQKSSQIASESYSSALNLTSARDQAASNVRVQKESVRVARAKLARVMAGGRTEEVVRAEASLRSAQATAALRKKTVERQKLLYDQGAIAGTNLEQAELSLATAEQDVASAEANLTLVKAPRREDINEAQASLDQTEANLQAAKVVLDNAEQDLKFRFSLRSQDTSARTESTTSSLAILTAQAEILRCQAAIANIDAQLKLSVLRSPINGTVTRKGVFPGETAQTGSELLRVTTSRKFRATADVDEKYVWQLEVGQSVSIQPEAFPGLIIPAKISGIERAANPDRGTVVVRFTLLAQDSRLRSNLTLDINVTTKEVPKAIVVPDASVVRDKDQAYVVGITNGVAERIPVELDRQTDTGTVVKRGIEPGREILLDPRAVQVGDRVAAEEKKS